MALPMTKAARALAEDCRQQAMQIQSLADSNLFIASLGFVDQDQYRLQLPKTLLPAHENLMASLLKARTAYEMADLLKLWLMT